MPIHNSRPLNLKLPQYNPPVNHTGLARLIKLSGHPKKLGKGLQTRLIKDIRATRNHRGHNPLWKRV